jgi:hypothetical protein
MHILDDRARAKVILAAGILGMGAQEGLSLLPGTVIKSAALLTLAVSVGLLLFAHGAAFKAGYEKARRDRIAPDRW